MSLSAGTRFRPYEIQSPLGVGGTGEVWRARDVRLEREVAVKVLPADLASDPEALSRLERASVCHRRLRQVTANLLEIDGLPPEVAPQVRQR